jgi:hypothetical protein
MQMNIIDNCEDYYKKDMVGCKEVSRSSFSSPDFRLVPNWLK